MIKVTPLVTITMDLKGDLQHNMDTLYEDLTRYDVPYLMVESGVLKYKSANAMCSSILTAMKKRHLDLSFKCIKNEDNKIMVFKV